MVGNRTRNALSRLAHVAVLGLLAGSLVGCDSSRATWESAIAGTGSDVSLGDMGYLGPVERVGPGAVWRMRPAKDGYALTRTSDRAPVPPELIEIGPWVSGGEGASVVASGAADAVVLSQITGLAGDLAPDLAEAKSVTLSPGASRLVQLKPEPFLTWLDGLPDGDEYRQAVLRNERLIASRLVEVNGMTADVTFDAATAARLRTALADGGETSSAQANMGVPLMVTWTSDTTLRLAAQEPFYVFTGLSRYAPAPGGGRGLLVPIAIAQDAPMMYEVF